MSDDRTFLSQEDCAALLARAVASTTGKGETHLSIASRWTGTTHWARNRVDVAAERQAVDVRVRRILPERWDGESSTTRIDDAGLSEVVRLAERSGNLLTGDRPTVELSDEGLQVRILRAAADVPLMSPTLWSDATFQLSAAARTAIGREMLDRARAGGLLAAGTLQCTAEAHAVMGTNGIARYFPVTTVDCSMTVRDLASNASGWAGINHYDLAQVDPLAVGRVALEKCQQGANPKRIEPGRYTAILEPQAVHDLVAPLVDDWMERSTAEGMRGPFAGPSEESGSKIGEQVIDARLTLSADPMDPEAGFFPFDQGDGTPYRAVTWIDRGFLRELAYDLRFAVQRLGSERTLLNSGSFRLSATPDVPTTPLAAMIAATKRGLLVTRLSDVRVLTGGNMLSTGFTRDGLWLIENGEITKPITNFRFRESPLFIMNRVEAIGAPTRVWAPGKARMAPALMVRDFNFSGVADAV